MTDACAGLTVQAIVLTHQAPASLDRCLQAIDRQSRPVDHILVVDNASTVPASLGARHAAGRVLRRNVNDGPGGGHAAGFEDFAASAFDLAWVMDDDCVPAARCLEELLARAESPDAAGLVLPLWIDGVSGAARFLPAWCGLLISRSLVKRIGVPRSDFVWWAEDTEYLQWRVLHAGLHHVTAERAVVEHYRVRVSDTKPAWKIYYETRNTIFYRVFVQPRTVNHLKLLLRSLGGLTIQALRRGDHGWARRVALGRGVVDGFGRRLGLRVPLG